MKSRLQVRRFSFLCSLGIATLQVCGSPAAVAAESSSGVVTVQVKPDFLQKTARNQEQDLSRLWKRFQELNLVVTRFDVVQTGNAKIVIRYSATSGLVAIP